MPGELSPWRIHVPAVDFPLRTHSAEHVLLWQVHGSSEILVNGVPHALSPGTALWIPAGLPHSGRVRDDAVFLPMFFPVDAIATTLDVPVVAPVSTEFHPLLLAKVQSEYSIIRPPTSIARQILAWIEDIPAGGEGAAGLPAPLSGPAASVADALRFNPGDSRSAGELAASVHASARTVLRAFRADTGMTLQQWRTRCRMESAAALLRTASSVEAVAHRVGYTSESAFRRAFKAHFGVPTGQYLRISRPG